MRADIDFVDDVRDVPFLVDNERDSLGESSVVNSVGLGNGTIRVTEQRIIQVQLLGKPGVQLYGVTTGSEKGNIEVF